MDAPERIWIDWKAANRMYLAYDEAPEHEDQVCRDAYVRADIHAAIATERDALAAKVERARKVKGLVWEDWASGGEVAEAKVTGTSYYIKISIVPGHQGEYRLSGPWAAYRYYPTLEAAKAAAQADYEARFLAALE